MFFLIDAVARWFARWDGGCDVDVDPLASPDRGHVSWSWADASARRPAA